MRGIRVAFERPAILFVRRWQRTGARGQRRFLSAFCPLYLDGVTGRRQPSWECGRPLHGDMNVKNFYLMELSSYCERNRRSEGSSP
jgi:hypothetical protein